MHKLRSTLTALGIIFGVCSVIAMLAIGEGASREAQAQIARLGSTNIIVKTIKPPEEESGSTQGDLLKEYGLTYDDAERFYETLPDARVVVPQRRLVQEVWYRTRKTSVEVVGTIPWYLEIEPIELIEGRFLQPVDMDYRQSVCVLDEPVYDKLLVFDDPLGADIKFGGDYYRIVGVVSAASLPKTNQNGQASGASSSVGNGGVVGNIYIPLTTAKQRFGEINLQLTSGTRQMEKVELQQITVQVENTAQVLPTRDVLEVLMGRFHGKKDYQVIVPLELLRQAAQTKRIFSIVLGSIAAISLLVGGIGIMNIMLATVSERTREIGIRRALGAKRRDIIFQFLSETVMLTMAGGMLGIILGALIPFLVTYFAQMPTVITATALLLSFGISAAIGVAFGMYPAWRAAHMDPIESLRHE